MRGPEGTKVRGQRWEDGGWPVGGATSSLCGGGGNDHTLSQLSVRGAEPLVMLRRIDQRNSFIVIFPLKLS